MRVNAKQNKSNSKSKVYQVDALFFFLSFDVVLDSQGRRQINVTAKTTILSIFTLLKHVV